MTETEPNAIRTPTSDAGQVQGPATAAEESPPAATPPPTGPHWGTGRRKTSVARVRLILGDGKFVINKRPYTEYFRQLRDQNDVVAPLELIGVRNRWDVLVNVRGGGVTGQAGAVRLGVARALAKAYPQHETALRDAGFLTRDAREVERKKYGRRKARRRFQFSKR